MASSQDILAAKLKTLISILREPNRGVAETYRLAARLLRNQMRPPATWGYEYILQVARGSLPVSKRLERAIYLLEKKVLNQTKIDYETVEVTAPSGYLVPGTLILLPAKKCANPCCNRYFLPVNPNHRYCSRLCRNAKTKESGREKLD